MTVRLPDDSSISQRSPPVDLCVSKPLADLVAFIKVKRVATNLSTHHQRQVVTYAVNEGVAIDLGLEVDLLRMSRQRTR